MKFLPNFGALLGSGALSSRKIVIISVATVAMAAVSTAAFAFWVGSTSGSGIAASSSSIAALAVTPGTASIGLRPGGTVNVVVSVANPNAYSVKFSSLTLDATQGSSGFAIDANHVAANCTASLAALTFTPISTGWTVLASSSLTVTATAALTMGVGAASPCQGATITVYLKAS